MSKAYVEKNQVKCKAFRYDGVEFCEITDQPPNDTRAVINVHANHGSPCAL